jgi:hypothetical protein
MDYCLDQGARAPMLRVECHVMSSVTSSVGTGTEVSQEGSAGRLLIQSVDRQVLVPS